MKVTWIYVSYDEMMHLVLNIFIFLNSMRLSNIDTLDDWLTSSVGHLDPIRKASTLTLVNDTLDTSHDGLHTEGYFIDSYTWYYW